MNDPKNTQPVPEVVSTDWLEALGCRYRPGMKILVKDAWTGKMTETTVRNVDASVSITAEGIVNKLGFVCVYYDFVYDGKVGPETAWQTHRTIDELNPSNKALMRNSTK